MVHRSLKYSASAATLTRMTRSSPVDPILKAAAEPVRRVLLERLSAGPATASELATHAEVSPAGLVHHLGVLEDAGLVRSVKTGRVRVVTLDPAGLRRVEKWFDDRRAQWERAAAATARKRG